MTSFHRFIYIMLLVAFSVVTKSEQRSRRNEAMSDEGVMPEENALDESEPIPAPDTESDSEPKEDSDKCEDQLDTCGKWQTFGFCKLRAEYMETMCMKTCGFCSDGTPIEPEPCEDYNENCTAWAEAGLCETSTDYMIYRCRKSCNTC